MLQSCRERSVGPADGKPSTSDPEAGKDNNTPHGPSRPGRNWVHLSGTREGGTAPLFTQVVSSMETAYAQETLVEELIIVRIIEDGETSFELRDEHGNYVADHTTLAGVFADAITTADMHDIEFVKLQVAAEIH